MAGAETVFLSLDRGLKNLIFSWGIPEPWAFLCAVAVYAVAVLGFVLVNVIFLVYLERKVAGYMQQRLGPNRVGPGGIFQCVADALKLLGKEDIIPAGADRMCFRLASWLIFVPATMLFAVIPFGREMIVADLNVGVLYFLAVGSTATLVLFMAGWSSNNKYALLGSMRVVAQVISYEIPLAFSLLGVIMLAGSLRMGDIVAAQKPLWFVVLQPAAFVLYFVAAIAELNRGPFDLPEGEQEIVAGPFVEYSGMRYALFFLSEYANLLSVSALAVTLFLGGWQGPWLPSWLWFVIKVYVMVFLFMWVKWTFPRVRADHLLGLAWKFLLPASLANVLVTGVVIKLFSGIGG
ncbi:MAG: NADH-quinone oxidoreductase subunit NuoH [Clostridia bacterium]|jgi:NADH-quinone oxidoreductase subunit H|nr:NADH-quinone oxidoreductase subunit NuoH [Clostridia bacterium]MDH7572849.1 NADH-quinone oxidoreductase subunit NuoH [Clostridia bacterium]